MENKKEFAKYITLLAERHEKGINKTMMAFIWDELKPYSDTECAAALRHVCSHNRFFKDIIPDLLERLEDYKGKDLEDKARVETTRILEHLEKYGTYKKPAFSDPITRYLMSVRWPFQKWGDELENKDIAWWTKDFIASYVAEAKQGRGKKEATEATEALVLPAKDRQKNIQQTNDLVGGFLPGMRLKGVPEKKKKESQAQAPLKPPVKKPSKTRTCPEHGEYHSVGTILLGEVLGGDDKCFWSGCPKCRDDFDRFLAAQESKQRKKA